ncbi:MAG: hypothetical protein DLM67_20895 [Candidatus Nephthysia bennettiae]|nr:MAG: hypothetical protein DLM67_20895 [Candidatus Dormibacteraeota bacterium]
MRENARELKGAGHSGESLIMGSARKQEDTLAELRRARQQAINALLKARLEEQSQAAVAEAAEQVQRLLDVFLAARLEAAEPA